MNNQNGPLNNQEATLKLKKIETNQQNSKDL